MAAVAGVALPAAPPGASVAAPLIDLMDASPAAMGGGAPVLRPGAAKGGETQKENEPEILMM